MNNKNRALASIGSALTVVCPLYGYSAMYLHERIARMQETSLYGKLETVLSSLPNTSQPPFTVTDIATTAVIFVLGDLSYQLAKPLTRGFAHLYGARLEERMYSKR